MYTAMPQNKVFELKWSGAKLPRVGDIVTINFNNFGSGEVTGYFAQEGYLGVIVKLDSPPDWYVKQNKGKPLFGFAHVFGAELKS